MKPHFEKGFVETAELAQQDERFAFGLTLKYSLRRFDRWRYWWTCTRYGLFARQAIYVGVNTVGLTAIGVGIVLTQPWYIFVPWWAFVGLLMLKLWLMVWESYQWDIKGWS